MIGEATEEGKRTAMSRSWAGEGVEGRREDICTSRGVNGAVGTGRKRGRVRKARYVSM